MNELDKNKVLAVQNGYNFVKSATNINVYYRFPTKTSKKIKHWKFQCRVINTYQMNCKIPLKEYESSSWILYTKEYCIYSGGKKMNRITKTLVRILINCCRNVRIYVHMLARVFADLFYLYN